MAFHMLTNTVRKPPGVSGRSGRPYWFEKKVILRRSLARLNIAMHTIISSGNDQQLHIKIEPFVKLIASTSHYLSLPPTHPQTTRAGVLRQFW